MKVLKTVAMLFLMSTMLLFCGCEPKIWSVDFTTVSNISDWLVSGPYALNEAGVVGLRLAPDSWVVAPVVFRGDFDLKLAFTLLGKTGGEMDFEMGFSGEADDIHETAVCFYGIANTGTDLYYGAWEIDFDNEDTYGYLYENTGPLPKLVADGLTVNELIISKVGKHFKVYLKDTLIFEYNQGNYYDSSYYCPWIWVDNFSVPDDWIVFKSIEVKYKGTMIST